MEKKQVQQQKYDPRISLNKDTKQKTVVLHQQYGIEPNHPLYGQIQSLVLELRKKETRKQNSHLHQVCEYTYYPLFEFQLMKSHPKHQMCCICQYQFKDHHDLYADLKHDGPEDIVCLGHCQHLFHKECIGNYVGKKIWLKCPVCSVIYGVMTGDQPDGTISINVDKNMKCAGYNCGTIIINYNFKGGVREGRPFPGTSRTGYLPDNEEGRKVRDLLKIAFQRKLVFTIGRSVTTGQQHVIVWNGIHHKTTVNGGAANFGYPDPTYLMRVRQELAAKGVH